MARTRRKPSASMASVTRLERPEVQTATSRIRAAYLHAMMKIEVGSTVAEIADVREMLRAAEQEAIDIMNGRHDDWFDHPVLALDDLRQSATMIRSALTRLDNCEAVAPISGPVAKVIDLRKARIELRERAR